MNKAQRTTLARVSAVLSTQLNLVQEVTAEEQERFDNMSETTQQGEKGDECGEEISTLEEISSNIEGAIEELDNLSQEN